MGLVHHLLKGERGTDVLQVRHAVDSEGPVLWICSTHGGRRTERKGHIPAKEERELSEKKVMIATINFEETHHSSSVLVSNKPRETGVAVEVAVASTQSRARYRERERESDRIHGNL